MSESNDQVRATVRDHYAQVAEAEKGGCAPGCCGVPAGSSLSLGYSAEDLASVPEGADLGLGCGNPQAIAKLRPGETVVDLGSGAGFDCFLAARQVGDAGKVIGVDMRLDNPLKIELFALDIFDDLVCGIIGDVAGGVVDVHDGIDDGAGIGG